MLEHPSVKHLGPISTFAPIGMFDLGRTSALTPSVKRALLEGMDGIALMSLLKPKLLEMDSS